MKNALIATAALAALTAVPAIAQAQTAAASNVGAYANLNLGLAEDGHADVKTVQGRLGYRFSPYFGLEGELATGIDSDTDTIGGVQVTSKLKHEAAAYGVGFLPIGPNTDLLARVGYGTTRLRTKVAGISDTDSTESWNFGVGAQHLFDGVNGIRVDYTRQEFYRDDGHANVWTLGYVRKF